MRSIAVALLMSVTTSVAVAACPEDEPLGVVRIDSNISTAIDATWTFKIWFDETASGAVSSIDLDSASLVCSAAAYSVGNGDETLPKDDPDDCPTYGPTDCVAFCSDAASIFSTAGSNMGESAGYQVAEWFWGAAGSVRSIPTENAPSIFQVSFFVSARDTEGFVAGEEGCPDYTSIGNTFNAGYAAALGHVSYSWPAGVTNDLVAYIDFDIYLDTDPTGVSTATPAHCRAGATQSINSGGSSFSYGPSGLNYHWILVGGQYYVLGYEYDAADPAGLIRTIGLDVSGSAVEIPLTGDGLDVISGSGNVGDLSVFDIASPGLTEPTPGMGDPPVIDCREVAKFARELAVNPSSPFSGYSSAVQDAFDLDGDSDIDDADLSIFASLFDAEAAERYLGDGNDDCIVDECDFLLLRELILNDDTPMGSPDGVIESTHPLYNEFLDVNQDNQLDASDEGNVSTPNSLIGFAWSEGTIDYFDGDVNGDWYVNIADTLYVIARFGTMDLSADANGDGSVTITDNLYVIARFGTATPDGDLMTECE